MSHRAVSHRESFSLASSPLRRKCMLNSSISDSNLEQVRGKICVTDNLNVCVAFNNIFIDETLPVQSYQRYYDPEV